MLYCNTVTIQMTQTHHVTRRRAASLLLAALDEPDFSSRTTNPHQSTTFRRRRHTPRSQPESAWIARENRRGESLFFRINYHGGGTSHALYRFEPFPHFSRMPSLSSCPSAQSTSSLFILSLQLLFAGHTLLYCNV